MNDDPGKWYQIANADEVASPALLVYPDRIEGNVRKMIALAGGPERLRPHIKTHKMREVLRLQQSLGIAKFKCATLAEAQMAADCGALHVLLAYQPVGPNVGRLLELIEQFPATRFAAIIDNAESVHAIARAAQARNLTVELLLDVDCGMRRTGIPPGVGAIGLYTLISSTLGVTAGGLHAYDGHIHARNPKARAIAAQSAMKPVHALREQLRQGGFLVPRLVVGGTPTFPIHARAPDSECSPGTCVLWDAGYSAMLPEMDFLPAALVLARVVSKPGTGRLCLDLGHKAVASEFSPPRVQWLELPEATPVIHDEEHLVLETAHAGNFNVGDVLYGVPWHICPTVALHAFASVVQFSCVDARWKVAARDRELSI